jgi:release factor glutamine methyltransferase
MGVNIQTIKDIRLYLFKELKEIYHEQEISAITNNIIKTVFGIVKLHQIYNSDQPVTKEQTGEILKICDELKTGKPLQYILGETTFYDCIIRVDSSTLIPRPETEEMVDIIIRENKDFKGNILDIGTGSGCIAIALAKNIPGAQITGIDISGNAIAVAQKNAEINNVSVSFSEGDIFSFDPSITSEAGIIVSNPPYVSESEKKFMSRNVLGFEPPEALFVPDTDPLKFYKQILTIGDKILVPNGRIYFEINEAMGKPMTELVESSGYSEIKIIKDLNCKDRILKGRKNG